MIKSELYKILKNQILIIIGTMFSVGIFSFNLLFIISSHNFNVNFKSMSTLLALNIISYIIFSLLLSVLGFREEVKASNFFNIVVSGKERKFYMTKLISYFSFISFINFIVNTILVFSTMFTLKNAILYFAAIELSTMFILLMQSIILILINEVYLFIYTGIEILIIIFISNTEPSKMWLLFPSNYGYGMYQRMFEITPIDILIITFVFLALIVINYIFIKKIKEKN